MSWKCRKSHGILDTTLNVVDTLLKLSNITSTDQTCNKIEKCKLIQYFPLFSPHTPFIIPRGHQRKSSPPHPDREARNVTLAQIIW